MSVEFWTNLKSDLKLTAKDIFGNNSIKEKYVAMNGNKLAEEGLTAENLLIDYNNIIEDQTEYIFEDEGTFFTEIALQNSKFNTGAKARRAERVIEQIKKYAACIDRTGLDEYKDVDLNVVVNNANSLADELSDKVDKSENF